MNELWYRIQLEAVCVRGCLASSVMTEEQKARCLLGIALKLREQANEVEKEAKKIHPQTVEQLRRGDISIHAARDRAWAEARDRISVFMQVRETTQSETVRGLATLVLAELTYRSSISTEI